MPSVRRAYPDEPQKGGVRGVLDSWSMGLRADEFGTALAAIDSYQDDRARDFMIWGIYEIAIFDTQKVLDLSGVSVNGATGIVSAPEYSPNEGANLLMTGVAYGGNYAGMEDYADAQGSPNRFLKTLENNADRFSGTENALIITFKPNGTGAYEVKTYMGAIAAENLVYSDSSVTNGTGGDGSKQLLSQVSEGNRRIYFQSHWDSGVKFSELTIGEPPQ